MRGTACGGRGPCRWTLLVLSLLLLQNERLLLHLLGQTFKVVVLQVVKVAWKAKRLEKLLFKLAVILRLLIVCLLIIKIPVRGYTLGLVSVLLSCARIVTRSFGTNRHLVTHMAANARTVIRLCLFESSLIAFSCLADVSIGWLDVGLTEGQLLVSTVAICRTSAYGEVGATINALSHLLLLLLLLLVSQELRWIESLAAL